VPATLCANKNHDFILISAARKVNFITQVFSLLGNGVPCWCYIIFQRV